MSARYEFLEEDNELVTDPTELAELDDLLTWRPGVVALILGNPYATAGVIVGTRQQIAARLRACLALLND